MSGPVTGQLNLMSAGHGVAHAEEQTAGAPGGVRVHGIQLWVAQPEVGRERGEVDRAAEWNAEDPRFGTVASALPRITAPTSGIA